MSKQFNFGDKASVITDFLMISSYNTNQAIPLLGGKRIKRYENPRGLHVITVTDLLIYLNATLKNKTGERDLWCIKSRQ